MVSPLRPSLYMGLVFYPVSALLYRKGDIWLSSDLVKFFSRNFFCRYHLNPIYTWRLMNPRITRQAERRSVPRDTKRISREDFLKDLSKNLKRSPAFGAKAFFRGLNTFTFSPVESFFFLWERGCFLGASLGGWNLSMAGKACPGGVGRLGFLVWEGMEDISWVSSSTNSFKTGICENASSVW